MFFSAFDYGETNKTGKSFAATCENVAIAAIYLKLIAAIFENNSLAFVIFLKCHRLTSS